MGDLGPVAVIGAGGHAAIVVSTLDEAGVEIAGLFDDNEATHGTSVLGYTVLGPPELACEMGVRRAIIGIGDNRVRRWMTERLATIEWITLIHPRAYVHPTARIGQGTVVMIDAVIRPYTRVGSHAIINTKAVVGHNCTVGDFAHLAGSAHMGGGSSIAEGGFVGLGAVLVPERHVGAWATVGAGGVVAHDIPPHTVAVGVPARVIKRED